MKKLNMEAIKLYNTDYVLLNDKEEFITSKTGQIFITPDLQEAKKTGWKVLCCGELNQKQKQILIENIKQFR